MGGGCSPGAVSLSMRRTLLLLALQLGLLLGAAAGMTDDFNGWTSETLRRQRIAAQPQAVLPVQMLDSNGQPFRLDQAIRDDGRWLLLAFVYSRCNSVCSVLGNEFQQLQADIQRRGLQQQVRLLSISFDPAHDTPEALGHYAMHLHADPAIWQFAVPQQPTALAALLQQFGIVVIDDGLGGYAHNAAIHLVSPKGRLVRIVDLQDYARVLAMLPLPGKKS